MREQKGITLIALVITIIVLLILAGVSIAMLTGDNGILTQAEKAETETDKAGMIEQVDLELAAIYGYMLTGQVPSTMQEEVNSRLTGVATFTIGEKSVAISLATSVSAAGIKVANETNTAGIAEKDSKIIMTTLASVNQ